MLKLNHKCDLYYFFLCTHKKKALSSFVFLYTHNKYYYYASIENIYINIFCKLLITIKTKLKCHNILHANIIKEII